MKTKRVKGGENMIKNKKAISGIIVTILLVLLVIVSVGLLWGFIMPFITGQLDEAGQTQACMTNSFSIQRASYRENDNVGIRISRVSGRLDVTKMRLMNRNDEIEDLDDNVPTSIGQKFDFVVTKGSGDYELTDGDRIYLEYVVLSDGQEITCTSEVATVVELT